MADLEFTGPFEEQFGAIKAAVIRHDAILDGNGKPGLVKDMSVQQSEMAVLKAYGESTVFWAKAIAALLTLLLLALGTYIATLEFRNKAGMLLPPKIGDNMSIQVIALKSVTEDARIHQ